MVRYCTVDNCRNNDASNEIRFFRAPNKEKQAEIHKKWSQFAGHELGKASFVCEKHFREDDFVGEMKLRLRKGAIPTLNCLDATATHVVTVIVSSMSTYSLVNLGNGEILQVNYIRNESVNENVFQAKKVKAPKASPPNQIEKKRHIKRIGKGLPSTVAARQGFRSANWKRLYMEHVKQTKKTKITIPRARHMVSQAKRNIRQTYAARLGTVFTDLQIEKILSGKRKVWTFQEIALGLKLKYSSNTYENLRHLGYPLPSATTMKEYLGKINFIPGIQYRVLDLLKDEFKKATPFRRQCVVIFDDMAINPRYEYFTAGDRVLGGKKNVSVFMVRGLFEPWKQVFAFDFCDRLTKKAFYEAIEKLELAGLVVRAVICDMGPKNRSLWKNLGVEVIRSEESFIIKNSVRSPVNHNKIYFYADVPHLLKLLMNHTVAVGKGIRLENGEEIKREDFQHLFRREMPNDIKKLWKLLPEHLDMSNREKMRVGPATNLFSHETAAVWRYEFKERGTEAEFIDLIASCFNILTSRPNSKNLTQEKKAFGKNLPQQLDILSRTAMSVSRLRVIGSQCFMPFQQGFLLSITSTRQLFEDLTAGNMGVHYMYTSRTTQDAVENLFACVRGSGSSNMPSAVETVRRIKMHCLSAAPKISRNVSTNIDPDQVPMLTSTMLHSLVKKKELGSVEDCDYVMGTSTSIDLIQEEGIEVNEMTLDTQDVILPEHSDHVSEEEALDYVLGFVARKLVDKFPKLSASKEEYDNVPDHWINYLKQSTLTLPSAEWKSKGSMLNKEFLKLHGPALTLSISQGVLGNFTKCLQLKYKEIPSKAVEMFLSVRLKIRMRHVNLSFARKTIQLYEIEKERIAKLRKLAENLQVTNANEFIPSVASEQHENNYEHQRTIFDSNSFSWSDNINSLASSYIGKPIREGQRIAINAILTGLDVILTMPTGSGKSAIFQLSTLASHGFALVISPLVSLVDDQIGQLVGKGITALNLTSGEQNAVESQLLTDFESGNPIAKFLYVTPEKLAHCKPLLDALKNSVKFEKDFLSLIVIDEAHCYVEWGKSFRPDYLWLKKLKELFPDVPVLAMSATLSPNMVQELKEDLKLENAVIIREKTVRKNLCLNIQYRNSKESMVTNYVIQKLGQSGIVFCNTIRECDAVKQALCKVGVSCACYHAKLHDETRKKLLQCWLKGSIRVMVATLAFGLGVNKPDCRFVVHYSLPSTLNDYIQQCGRAGRDGSSGECLLIFGMDDTVGSIGRVFHERNGIPNLHAVINFAVQSSQCRLKCLADIYDGGSTSLDPCNCDVCSTRVPMIRVNITEFVLKSSEFIKKCSEKGQKVYPKALLDQLEGKSRDKSYSDIILSEQRSRPLNEQILLWSLANSYLEEEFTYGRIRTFVSVKLGHKSVTLDSDSTIFVAFQNV